MCARPLRNHPVIKPLPTIADVSKHKPLAFAITRYANEDPFSISTGRYLLKFSVYI